MVEVYAILIGFEGTDEVKKIQRGVGGIQEDIIGNCFEKRFKLDAGEFSFVNWVCDECNKLPRGVVCQCKE